MVVTMILAAGTIIDIAGRPGEWKEWLMNCSGDRYDYNIHKGS